MSIFSIILCIVLAGAVIAVITAILIRYFKEISAARKRLASLNSRVINTIDGPVEYASTGQGYPLLVVHGAIGGFDQGLYVAESLRIPKCQLISVSRFGHLQTPVPQNATLDTQADSFAYLLDELKIKKAAVFAISAGTTSAIRFAARHPEKVSALILFGPDAPGKNEISLPPKFVFDVLFRSNFFYWFLITYFRSSMEKMMGLVPKGFTTKPEHQARIRNILSLDLPSDRRIDGLIFETYPIAAEYNAAVTDSSPYPLGNIKTPVLTVNALDDPISTAENVHNLAKQFPNGQQYIVPDGGHLYFNHDQEVRSEIIAFLANTISELKEIK